MGRTYESAWEMRCSKLMHFQRGGDDLGSDTMAARFALLDGVRRAFAVIRNLSHHNFSLPYDSILECIGVHI